MVQGSHMKTLQYLRYVYPRRLVRGNHMKTLQYLHQNNYKNSYQFMSADSLRGTAEQHFNFFFLWRIL